MVIHVNGGRPPEHGGINNGNPARVMTIVEPDATRAALLNEALDRVLNEKFCLIHFYVSAANSGEDRRLFFERRKQNMSVSNSGVKDSLSIRLPPGKPCLRYPNAFLRRRYEVKELADAGYT